LGRQRRGDRDPFSIRRLPKCFRCANTRGFDSGDCWESKDSAAGERPGTKSEADSPTVLRLPTPWPTIDSDAGDRPGLPYPNFEQNAGHKAVRTSPTPAAPRAESTLPGSRSDVGYVTHPDSGA